jgi:transposase-like protein
MSVLSKSRFHDEAAAFEFLESALWPHGPVCPHCRGKDRISKIKPNPEKRVRVGLYKCGPCKKQFTVKVGTVFEHARVPLHKMLQAVHLMCSSKKGISAHQMHRILEVQYNTAWFIEHRIREAMRTGELAPMGGAGGIVEADETFIGREPGKPKKRAYHHKMKVLSLIDRETGQARSMVVDDLKPATIAPILRENMAREARLATDEAGHYLKVGKEFADHGIVRHGKEEAHL